MASITETKSFYLLCPIRFYFRGDLIAAWAGAKITGRSSLHSFYASTLNLIAFFKSAMDQRTYKECDEGIGILLVNNFLQLPDFILVHGTERIFLGWLVYAPYPFQKVTPRPIFCRISVCTVETSVNIRAATLMFWS